MNLEKDLNCAFCVVQMNLYGKLRRRGGGGVGGGRLEVVALLWVNGQAKLGRLFVLGSRRKMLTYGNVVDASVRRANR